MYMVFLALSCDGAAVKIISQWASKAAPMAAQVAVGNRVMGSHCCSSLFKRGAPANAY